MIIFNEEYEYYMLFVAHCVLFIEALFCVTKSAFYLSIVKAPNKKAFLMVLNKDFAILIYCLWYSYLELNFIGSYFDDTPQHFYELYAMSMQIIFMGMHIFRKEEQSG